MVDAVVDLNDSSKDPSEGAHDAERVLRDQGFNHVDSTGTPTFLLLFWVTPDFFVELQVSLPVLLLSPSFLLQRLQ